MRYQIRSLKTAVLVLPLLLQACTASRAMPADGPRAGDLVFFWTSEKVRHVGIYLEDGDFFHASTSKGVMISNMKERYWRDRLISIRRVKHKLSLKSLRQAYAKYDPARYGYGKTGPHRFDCSGLVWRVFQDHGIALPRSTRGQIKAGTAVPKS